MSNVSSGDQGTYMGPQGEHQKHVTAGIAGSASMVQTIGGAAAVVLTILGLAGMYPLYMVAIATIAVAAAMALQGMAIASRYSQFVHETGGTHPVAEIRTGLTAEFIAGAAGVVLGVLALLGLDAAVLTTIAVIVLGCGMLLGAGVPSRLAHFYSGGGSHPHPFFEHATADAVVAATGAEVLVGGGAVVLGVIALVNPPALTLTLVALLAMGSSTLATGSALAGRMGSVWEQH